jgi:hypothetical protein
MAAPVQNNLRMSTTETLTHRLDALAGALRDAGVDADRVATILGSAATATMNALLLDAVVEENLTAPPTLEAAQELPAVEIVERPLRVAA